MFGIPGKQAVSITPAAAAQIAKLMDRDGSQGLRIGVKKGRLRGHGIHHGLRDRGRPQ
jgi:iron-sulfur cluster assembly protein